MKDTFDPSVRWEQLVASQSSPSRERFVELFQAGDREQIILATVPLIRKFNKGTQQAIKDDVECYAITEVAKAVDELLRHPNSNPGSYLIDVIRHAIHSARFGVSKEARDCVSSDLRIYRPRKRESDAERDVLIAKLELDGCSLQMIDAELQAKGFDRDRIVNTESAWPTAKVRGKDDKHFTGEHVSAEFGAEQPAVDDRWELLAELCDEDELELLTMLAAGMTRDEAAEELNCHEQTITRKLAAIRAKVQRHENED